MTYFTKGAWHRIFLAFEVSGTRRPLSMLTGLMIYERDVPHKQCSWSGWMRMPWRFARTLDGDGEPTHAWCFRMHWEGDALRSVYRQVFVQGDIGCMWDSNAQLYVTIRMVSLKCLLAVDNGDDDGVLYV